MRQLRIACLGDYVNYYSYFLYGVMEGSISNGHLFRPIALPTPKLEFSLSHVRDQLLFFKPEILFCHCIFNERGFNRAELFGLLDLMRKKCGTKVCYHMGDNRTIPRYPHNISDIVDLGLIGHCNIKKWEDIWKVKCIEWPYACLRQKTLQPVEDRFKSPIVFTGNLSNTGVHSERTRFVENLRAGAEERKIELKIYPDAVIGNSRFFTNVVSSSAEAVLGIQIEGGDKGWLDVRPFQYIGAGALYFHDHCSNIRRYFEPMVHYIEYEKDNPESFWEVYDHFVHKPNGDFKISADMIRNTGFRYCQKFHSTEARVKRVIDFFEGKKLQPLTLKEVLAG